MNLLRFVRFSLFSLSVTLVLSGWMRGDNHLRYLSNDAFGFGERLEYSVGYKFITAGKATFSVAPKPVIRNDRPCYDIRFEVKSLESLEWIYRVRDIYRTLVDVSGIFPWEFEQHIREGGYSRDYKATFDQQKNKAKSGDQEFNIPPYVHDIVSAFYYLRSIDLKDKKKGDMIQLENFFNNKTNELAVKVLGRQIVEVSAGKFRAIVVEPMVKEGGLFKSNGRILIWLSDDERKVPIKVSTQIPIGAIDAELTGVSGLRGPLSSRLSD